MPKERIPDRLYRIHQLHLEPEFFDDKADNNRFNPPAGSPPAFGTCYLSTHPLGCYIETLGRMGSISQSDLDARGVSEAVVPVGIRLADMTHPGLLGRFHLTAEIGAGSGYARPSQWAERLYQAGFAGVWYRARHDVSAGDGYWRATYELPEMFSVALFGMPGVRPDQLKIISPHPSPISAEVVEVGRRAFRLLVLPAVPI